MKLHTKSAVAALLVILASVGMVQSKAHDQGVADGDFEPGTQTGAKDTIDFLESIGATDGKGVSALTKGGARGETASGKGGDNRTIPVTGNGKK